DDSVVRLEVKGVQKPLTRTPLSSAQILRLLKEAADPGVRAQLDTGAPTTFLRLTDDGTFIIEARTTDGKMHVGIRVDPTAPKPVRPTPHVPGASISATPTAPPPGPRLSRPIGPLGIDNGAEGGTASLDEIRNFEGSGEARAALDSLLRKMVEVGASDLHLRVGEPPVLRHHGEM